MTKEDILYPFGYIIAEEELNEIPAHFSKRLILNHYFYYFHNTMNINIFEYEDKFILIHGEYVHVGIDNQYNQEELLQILFKYYFNDYDKFLDTLDFIGGRFVIILGDINNITVFPDATNSRTTYYTTDRNVLSSHVFLINDNYKYDRPQSNSNFYNKLLNAARIGIRSTVPNYSLSLNSNSQKRFFPRENNKYKSLEENEKFELIERFWKKQIEYHVLNKGNLIFSLTGGGDSRFSLSLAREYIDNIEFFTYASTDGEDNTSYATRLLSLDDYIVKEMLKDLNIKHKFFYLDQDDKTLTQKETFVLNKNTIERHSAFVIPYMKKNYSILPLNHIRANLLEIGQAFYYNTEYKDNILSSSRTAFRNEHKRYLKSDESSSMLDDMFNEYVEEMKFGEDIFDYHILDLHYWEIKMGRWHSEILNTHDIVFNTISPFNHRALIDLTLSFSYEKRKSRYFQYEIINRNYPVLNFYGMNKKLNLYEQTRKKY